MNVISEKLDVINRFYIEGGEGVSEFWRRNKSPVEARELANLLLAIRKIARFIGPNVGSIVWSGMKSTDEASEISLNPSLVLGSYPVPGIKTDHAIGVVVRAAHKQTEWSERGINLVAQKLSKMSREKTYRMKKFLEMAEQIYLDLVANRSVLGFYAEKYRQAKFKEARGNFIQPPTVDELLHIWWLMAADRDGCQYQQEFTDLTYGIYGYNLEKYYKEPLRILNSIVGELIEECPKIQSVVGRCEYRAGLYLRIWKQYLNVTNFWITDMSDPTFMPKALDVGDIMDGELGEALKPILAIVAQEIEALLQSNRNLTEEVRMIANNDSEVVPIEVGDFVIPMKEPVDRDLVQKLRIALQRHCRKRNIISRGMKSGKIDARRLYRAPTTGEVFYYKKSKYEMENDLILLVDATGSMGGPKWKTMQQIFHAFYQVVRSFNKNTRVFAYNEVRNNCYLTELTLNKEGIYTVMPTGRTASGEAIIATALMHKRGMRVPFIIHLTDGASNWGCEVKYATDYCKKKKIKLMTLGFGCAKDNKAALEKEYGEQVEFVDTLQELPRKLIKLLSHTAYM
ncbi:MAG: vWA domain-containing protein [Desulfosporosinus sp.]